MTTERGSLWLGGAVCVLLLVNIGYSVNANEQAIKREKSVEQVREACEHQCEQDRATDKDYIDRLNSLLTAERLRADHEQAKAVVAEQLAKERLEEIQTLNVLLQQTRELLAAAGQKNQTLQRQIDELGVKIGEANKRLEAEERRSAKLQAENELMKTQRKQSARALSAAYAELGVIRYDNLVLRAQSEACDHGSEGSIEVCRGNVRKVLSTEDAKRQYKSCASLDGSGEPYLKQLGRTQRAPSTAIQLTDYPFLGGSAWFLIFCDPTLPD